MHAFLHESSRKSRVWPLSLASLACCLAACAAWAATIPPQSVEAQIVPSFSPGDKAFSVAIKVPEGTKLNFDGPWQLSVNGDIPFQKGTSLSLGKGDFEESGARFVLPVSSVAGSALAGKSSNYTLKYFLCSKDSSWCKRVVKSGQLSAPQ